VGALSAGHAVRLLEDGDDAVSEVWRRILAAIEEFGMRANPS
jgi:hypothetical protein